MNRVMQGSSAYCPGGKYSWTCTQDGYRYMVHGVLHGMNLLSGVLAESPISFKLDPMPSCCGAYIMHNINVSKPPTDVETSWFKENLCQIAKEESRGMILLTLSANQYCEKRFLSQTFNKHLKEGETWRNPNSGNYVTNYTINVLEALGELEDFWEDYDSNDWTNENGDFDWPRDD